MRYRRKQRFFVIHNKCIEKKTERFISGEGKKIFRANSHDLFIGLMIDGKPPWQQEKEQKGESSTVLMIQEQLFISELFKHVQDAVLLIFLLQDNVVTQRGFFHHIYHIGCAFNLHSIINSGLIFGGQSTSKRQTVFFLLVDLMDKSQEDLNEIDLNEPRHAQYLHHAWKRHQDAVYWVDIKLAQKKGLKFYQTRSNAIIFQETLPACCIPKVVWIKTGEVLHEKVYMSPRHPPKISLKHE